MLSILIPVYNHPISELIESLNREASQLNIVYEILIQDDASSLFREENLSAANLFKATYNFNDINAGRAATRQALATAAKYETLLFLDADVMPVKSDFIQTFLKHKNEADLLIGGTKYKSNLTDKNYSLRWKFGRKRESKTVKDRRKTPYLSIISACLFINKEVFLKVNNSPLNIYGMDIYFSYQLKKNRINVKHIENPIYHLGLETNEVFLAKSLQAIDTILLLDEQKAIPNDYSDLQRTYVKLKKYNLDRFAVYILRKFGLFFKKNLNSSNPKLLYFDLYRLSYYLKQKHA